ncbi:hypothetical protein QJS10_CPB11g01616 [Acorus calamus]|uniref:Uncharacterized protein n=1 Tax=Acorus calamus TaxID=4465 RepID=A0AAV9DX67_ACOCL|nr:hypothetical protein QJS10_CPB11g01616 [Acorus calamus]
MIHLIQDWGKHLIGLKTVNYTRGTLCIEEQQGLDGDIVEGINEMVGNAWHREGEGGEWRLRLRRISREDQVEEMVRLLGCIHDEKPRMTVADEMVWTSKPQYGYIVHKGYKWWSRARQDVPVMAARTEQIWS